MTGGSGRLAGLERGAVFCYYGPRRGLFRRRGIAAGVVLGIDQAKGVVHVRTMRQVGDASVTDIGHIPIAWSPFDRSLHVLADKAPRIADEAAGTVASWRQRNARGEVTAFSCLLWEAERMAWQALPDAERSHRDRERLYLAYAFPLAGAGGGVEVGVHTHEPAS